MKTITFLDPTYGKMPLYKNINSIFDQMIAGQYGRNGNFPS